MTSFQRLPQTGNYTNCAQVIVLLREGVYYPSMSECHKKGEKVVRSIHFGADDRLCTPIWVGSPDKLESAIQKYVDGQQGQYVKRQIMEAPATEGGGQHH